MICYVLFLQVVPTVYKDVSGNTIQSNQVYIPKPRSFLFLFYFYELLLHNLAMHNDASNGLLQFSVTEHVRTAEVGRLQSLPAVFFFYDLSPIKVGFSCVVQFVMRRQIHFPP